jgi:hypothetical protein
MKGGGEGFNLTSEIVGFIGDEFPLRARSNRE